MPRRPDRRPSASRRGYGPDWRKLRAATPKTPCVDCGAPWRPGFHLDHRLARAKGGTDDPSNLEWRCWRCHSAKTAQVDGGFGNAPGRHRPTRLAIGLDGWPLARGPTP